MGQRLGQASNTQLHHLHKTSSYKLPTAWPMMALPYYPLAPTTLAGQPHTKNCANTNYLAASLHPDVVATIGIDPLSSDTDIIFNAFQQRFSPKNHFQKLTTASFVIDSLKSSAESVDFFHWHFAQVTQLKISKKLEGLFNQSIAMVPPGLSHPAFSQLLTACIFGARGVILTEATIGQIVLSTGVRYENTAWHESPFINRFLEVDTQGQQESLPFLPSSPLPKSLWSLPALLTFQYPCCML
ncbi:hypothetical protein O181_003015 [Austropuccinia psidii MF-1]|uniref:Uncharacterized protein n=1 Tax=Austropuccinia psidii MF-1 TaxID=1389203 RepID=A0A9Q3GDF7_9BASI|nr:hypothetical protein [Austropuccinia psidii MF-1]